MEEIGVLQVYGAGAAYHFVSLLSPNLEVEIEFWDVVLAHSAM